MASDGSKFRQSPRFCWATTVLWGGRCASRGGGRRSSGASDRALGWPDGNVVYVAADNGPPPVGSDSLVRTPSIAAPKPVGWARAHFRSASHASPVTGDRGAAPVCNRRSTNWGRCRSFCRRGLTGSGSTPDSAFSAIDAALTLCNTRAPRRFSVRRKHRSAQSAKDVNTPP
jgi:hypothetical protein